MKQEHLQILITMPQGAVFETFWNDALLAELAKIGTVHLNETGAQYDEAALCKAVRGMDICITGWGCPIFTDAVLACADKLRFIAHTGGSVKPYVTDAVYEKGIRVASGNEVFAESVAEGVVAYALAALRKIPFYVNSAWPESFVNRGLLERSVGIVGYGMIARYVVGMLAPFHCPVTVFSRHIAQEELTRQHMQKADLETLFSTCEIVSIHSGMTAENHHLITESMLRSLRTGAVLINTARGAIIDEPALCRVLAERPDLTAVLDVYETEPLPAQHPLRALPNTFLMPHMGGPTIDRRFAVTRSVLADIRHFLADEPLLCEIDRAYAAKMSTF
ncbi:MAG: hydroxyacid dehydrogenase [Ruthenibacterium sp.]